MEVLEAVDRDRLATLRERDEFFWLDLTDPAPDEVKALGETLGLHPIAIEDSIEFRQRPKFDAYEDHLLFVYYTVRKGRGDGEELFEPVEIHIYISGSFVVTVRRAQCTELDALHHELDSADPGAEDYIVYRVFDVLTDAYYPIIDLLEERIDALESQILLQRPSHDQLAETYRLKQRVHDLSRRVVPQRDRFNTGLDAILELPGLARGTREYLRDIGDHLTQIASELHRQQEDLTALTATYFNANANRLNVVATRLTIGGTFFLVWTLVTGFFGQNFEWLVGNVETRHDFLLYGVGALVIPTVIIGTVFWIKRKDWF
ncbi:MAG TPA: magnesium transporter CorA family protein [Solirubrobacteraceae bacterium]|nr:magnesium transporter CorA family protein [Solirubrobacteraceae bacterium]